METNGTTSMPAAFLGHGNPMNALEHNRYTEAWRALGAAIPRPRAVVCISAHWFTQATAVTAMAHPRTIHDFFGFPPELNAVEYPAPGTPDLAEEVVSLLAPSWVGLDVDSWGLDHGTWSVLTHVFPDADVPIVQLAIDATAPAAVHFDLGRRLAPLRGEGIFVLGSGNVVHNLGRIDSGRPEDGFDWAHRFDDEAKRRMTETPASVVDLVAHPGFALAAPTPEHFLPLVYLAGLAAASGCGAEVLTEGYQMGSLSMTSYLVDQGPRPDRPNS